jgi:hypothetical protein
VYYHIALITVELDILGIEVDMYRSLILPASLSASVVALAIGILFIAIIVITSIKKCE